MRKRRARALWPRLAATPPGRARLAGDAGSNGSTGADLSGTGGTPVEGAVSELWHALQDRARPIIFALAGWTWASSPSLFLRSWLKVANLVDLLGSSFPSGSPLKGREGAHAVHAAGNPDRARRSGLMSS